MLFEELKQIIGIIKSDPAAVKLIVDSVFDKVFEKQSPRELIDGAIDHFFEKLKEQ